MCPCTPSCLSSSLALEDGHGDLLSFVTSSAAYCVKSKLLIDLLASGSCLCGLPIPPCPSGAMQLWTTGFLPLTAFSLWGTGRLHYQKHIFSSPLAVSCPSLLLCLFLASGVGWIASSCSVEGGDWLLTGMWLCQSSHVGTASGRIITVVNSGFHSSDFTEAVENTIQGSLFSLRRI